jgi:hypothetical protein
MSKELIIDCKFDGKGKALKNFVNTLFEGVNDEKIYHLKLNIQEQDRQKKILEE